MTIYIASHLGNTFADCSPSDIDAILTGMPGVQVRSTSIPWYDESWAREVSDIEIMRYEVTSDNGGYSYKLTMACCATDEVATRIYLRYTIHESTGGSPAELPVGDEILSFGPRRFWIRWNSLLVSIVADDTQTAETIEEFLKKMDTKFRKP